VLNEVERPKSLEPRVRRTVTLTRSAAFSIACLFLLLSTLTVLWFSWAVRQATSDSPRLGQAARQFVLNASYAGGLTRQAIMDVWASATSIPYPLLIPRDEIRKTVHFPAPDDSGYLLLSHLSREANQAIVRLIRISDGKVVAKWQPNFAAIHDIQNLDSKYKGPVSKLRSRANDPKLLLNGDIVYSTDGVLVRQSSCGPNVWMADGLFHHSTEVAADGNIWASSINPNPFQDNLYLNKEVRDDALAEVSPDGKLLRNLSFSQILISNGYSGLLLGHSGEKFLSDPIHLNDIQPALSTTKYWEKGDLLVSARNLSTIFLYRPSTGKIFWSKTGPWINQHDVNFLSDTAISVFGNDVIQPLAVPPVFMNSGRSNRIYVYDFAQDSIATPGAELMAEQQVRTATEGRGQVLPDGGLFVEETNYGRLLRFRDGKLLWSLVNDYDEERVGMVSWSSYLTEDQAREPLAAIAAQHCGSH